MTIKSYCLRRKCDQHWLADGCMGHYWTEAAVRADQMPWIEPMGAPYKYGSHPGSLNEILIRAISENETIEVVDGATKNLVMTVAPNWISSLRLWWSGWGKFAFQTAAKRSHAQ